MKAWATREGVQRRGSRFGKTTLHALLTNVAYCGRVRFEGKLFDGEHQRIPDDDLFDQVQERLHRNGSKGERKVRNKHGALLKGLVQCGSCGGAMIHTYVQKKKARYRYYVCAIAQQRGWNKCEKRSVSAPELEGAVISQLRNIAHDPAVLSEVIQQIAESRRPNELMTDPAEIQTALLRFDPLWEQLTTAEQESFIRTLVQEVKYDGATAEVTIGFHNNGIKQLCSPKIGVK
jgi:site-specific DNA recombinase